MGREGKGLDDSWKKNRNAYTGTEDYTKGLASKGWKMEGGKRDQKLLRDVSKDGRGAGFVKNVKAELDPNHEPC